MRERVRYFIEVAGPVEAGTLPIGALVDWVLEHVDTEQMDVTLTRDTLLDAVGDTGLMALAAEIASGGRAPDGAVDGMRKLTDIFNRATEYDPTADPVCECSTCMKTAPKGHEDPRCLLNFERPSLSDVMASWDWDVIAECWDLPWYVYQAQVDQRRSQNKGSAALHQEADRRRKEDDEAAKIREKHFGTSDWRKIGARNG